MLHCHYALYCTALHRLKRNGTERIETKSNGCLFFTYRYGMKHGFILNQIFNMYTGIFVSSLVFSFSPVKMTLPHVQFAHSPTNIWSIFLLLPRATLATFTNFPALLLHLAPSASPNIVEAPLYICPIQPSSFPSSQQPHLHPPLDHTTKQVHP